MSTKARRLTFIAAALFFFGACSHTAPTEMVNVGDGSHGWRITCGGFFSGTGECYDTAGYQCMNRGYTVLRETDITPPETTYWWNTGGAHEIVVKCNGA